MNNTVAIFVQHYLSPSMTFIYRQLKGSEKYYKPVVLCSFIKENLDLFPHSELYYKPKISYKFFRNKYLRIFNNPYFKNSYAPQLNSTQENFFIKKLTENSAKIIHAHFGPSGIEVLPLAKKLNLPLVVTFHGYDASTLLKNINYVLRLKELFDYAYIISVSNAMHNELLELGANESKSTVIRCGIPVEKFNYRERTPVHLKMKRGKKIVFLQVSNFVEKKGHRFTIEAFSKIKKFYPNILLVLAGDGILLNDIKKLVHYYNLNDSVEFLGKINENKVSEIMNSSDIFLHHSITSKEGDKEGLPTVLMEAMATGLPCVSTYHAGIPELIKDSINGYLVNESEIENYVNKIKLLLTKENNFSKKSRETVEAEFSLAKSVQALVNTYNKIIGNTI